MQDKELYRQILGIASPWSVDHLKLDLEKSAVSVFLYEDTGAPMVCPTCGQTSPVYDHREERTWRHLDSCQFLTFIVAAIPRVKCATHGVQTVDVPWSAVTQREPRRHLMRQ